VPISQSTSAASRAGPPCYITEYPISRLYEDARVTRIYGGTSAVVKSIISKSMGL
jgi:alkylation response protein AidB-like acyl-CoA dehydrogenase